jgi:hypothetical protein
VGYRKPYGCLGNLTDALHIPPHTGDVAMKSILAYLLIGSYALCSGVGGKGEEIRFPRLQRK